MKRLIVLVVATTCFILTVSRDCLAQDKIDVMTQNQYLGADLDPIVAGTVPFNQAVVEALSIIAANDIVTRSGLLASLIANRLPELVGLQEVYRFECYDLGPPTADTGCNDPRIANAFPVSIPPGVYVNDHLELTLQSLQQRGAIYQTAAVVHDLDLTANILGPGFPPGIPVFLDDDARPDITVTVLDRNVILARDDILATPVDYSSDCLGRESIDGCNYATFASAPSPLGPIDVKRSWVGVDATIDGKDYRFVTTHLEGERPDPTDPLSQFFQAAQAAELIDVLDSTPNDKSLIVVGDLNSSSKDVGIPAAGIVPPYMQLIDAGYTDTWTVTGNIPGFSCCQLADLSNQASILDERVDVIFSAEVPSKAKKKRVLGGKVSDKSSPPGQGFWPSDHGSVAVELQF
jgi:hypothetical protein